MGTGLQGHVIGWACSHDRQAERRLPFIQTETSSVGRHQRDVGQRTRLHNQGSPKQPGALPEPQGNRIQRHRTIELACGTYSGAKTNKNKQQAARGTKRSSFCRRAGELALDPGLDLPGEEGVDPGFLGVAALKASRDQAREGASADQGAPGISLRGKGHTWGERLSITPCRGRWLTHRGSLGPEDTPSPMQGACVCVSVQVHGSVCLSVYVPVYIRW